MSSCSAKSTCKAASYCVNLYRGRVVGRLRTERPTPALVDLDLTFPPCCLEAMPICCCPSRILQTANSPIKVNKKPLSDLAHDQVRTGHIPCKILQTHQRQPYRHVRHGGHDGEPVLHQLQQRMGRHSVPRTLLWLRKRIKTHNKKSSVQKIVAYFMVSS